MYHNFIHLSVNGHLGCFHVLAIVNSAAVNNGIHVSFSILVSSGYMPRSGIAGSYGGLGASLVAQTVKHLPAMRKTWVWSLGREDPLEKEMATHSNTLAWKIPWMEEPGGLQSMGSQSVEHDWATSLYGGFIPSFLRTLHTVFHSGCISLPSHQQCKSIPFTAHIFISFKSFFFAHE